MNPWLMLILVIIGEIFFIYSFIKSHYIHELLICIWLPTALIQYVTDNRTILTTTAIVQIIFFFLVIFFLFRSRKSRLTKLYSTLSEVGASQIPETDTNSDENIIETSADDTLSENTQSIDDDYNNKTS